MIYLQTVSQWLYPVMILMALFASARYIRLTKSSPLLAGGFGMLLASNILGKMMPMISRLLHIYPYHAFDLPTSYPIPMTPYYLFIVALSLIGSCGWALIAYGTYAVLEEVSKKLALLQLASQNGWNYQAAPNAFQTQTAQNPQAQSAFIQNQPSQNPLNQPIQEQVREETHAPAYVSSAAPAPTVADNRPVVSVQPEQPTGPLTLGSSR